MSELHPPKRKHNRRKPVYTLTTGLTQTHLNEPISTHLRLSGALKALGVYHRATLKGVRFQNARIVAYITTNNEPDAIRLAIQNLTPNLSRTQLEQLAVFQLPDLTSFVPRNQILPEHRNQQQKAYIRIARDQPLWADRRKRIEQNRPQLGE